MDRPRWSRNCMIAGAVLGLAGALMFILGGTAQAYSVSSIGWGIAGIGSLLLFIGRYGPELAGPKPVRPDEPEPAQPPFGVVNVSERERLREERRRPPNTMLVQRFLLPGRFIGPGWVVFGTLMVIRTTARSAPAAPIILAMVVTVAGIVLTVASWQWYLRWRRDRDLDT